MNRNIQQIITKIRPVLEAGGVSRASLFGSVARGENHPDSDIDLLVDIRIPMSLLEFIGLQNKLEDAVGTKIDLVEYNTIKPALKKYILVDQIQII
ncbi:MAG: nucleotidyltransferase family protein [bacterium]|nr:nucleotidyltransferase family protein [bacterium]